MVFLRRQPGSRSNFWASIESGDGSPFKGLPVKLIGALLGFVSEEPLVEFWANYPDVPPEIDESMPACEGMSDRFLALLRERGIEAFVAGMFQTREEAGRNLANGYGASMQYGTIIAVTTEKVQ